MLREGEGTRIMGLRMRDCQRGKERGWGEREGAAHMMRALRVPNASLGGTEGRRQERKRRKDIRSLGEYLSRGRRRRRRGREVGTFIPPRTHPLFAHSC